MMNTLTEVAIADQPSPLEIVMTALEATGRLRNSPPRGYHPAYFHRDNFRELFVEERPDGWVAYITFRDVTPGAPDCAKTPEHAPYDTPFEAFLAGAAVVCEIATGSQELPFILHGDKLICMTYGA